MSVASPLAALGLVLRQSAQEARLNAALLKKNEAATRAALIDPVLRALGWDTANVRMVEPEKTIGGDLRVDYVLHDSNGKPCFVIEAKCLGESLDKHGYVSKILGYALGFNVQTVFITDGLHWHCYSGLQLGGRNEPVLLQLSEQDALPAALGLIQLLDAAHAGHVPAGAAGTPTTEVREKEKPAEPAPGPSAKPSRRAVNSIANAPAAGQFIPLQETHRFPAGQKPTRLRLPDGSVRQLRTWKDVLLETCYFVLAAAPHLPLPLADKAGKKRFLLQSDEPVGASTPATYQNQRIFIGTHYSAKDCLANALHILRQLPPAARAAEVALAF